MTAETGKVIYFMNQIFQINQEDLRTVLTEIVFGIINESRENTKQNDNCELLTPKNVRERLAVSSSTLWRWEKENYLCPVRVGGKVFYRSSDIKVIEKGGEK